MRRLAIELEGSGSREARAQRRADPRTSLPRFADALADAKSERKRFRVLRPRLAGDAQRDRRDQRRPSTGRALQRVSRTFKLELRATTSGAGRPAHRQGAGAERASVVYGQIAPEEALEFCADLGYRVTLRIEELE